MIFDLEDLDQLQQFVRERGVVYFRLTGGLGNQLFGLSEAYGIHKDVGRGVAIDVGSLEHTLGDDPEWLEWSVSQIWITLIRIPKNVSAKFELTNLGDMPSEAHSDSRYLTGWRFSLNRVRRTGLFSEGEFPFRVDTVKRVETTIHYRVGDYVNAKGLGVLGVPYYVRAANSLDLEGQIKLFSDDNDSAQQLIEALKLSNVTVNTSINAIDVLYQISQARCIVAANSTLSWWAIYFSCAEKVICPTPFYLQAWNFDREARFPTAHYLSRFKNPRQKLSTWFLWRLRSVKSLILRSFRSARIRKK